MCSVGEDDLDIDSCTQWNEFDDKELSSKEVVSTCCKCGFTGFVVKTQFRGAECRECFLIYANHKFRATLGASKVIPKNSKVLIFFDGSSEGLVLMDMVRSLQAKTSLKSFSCAAQVLYLDEMHLESEKTEHNEKLQRIARVLKNFKSFEIFVAPFEVNREPLPTLCSIDEYLGQNFENVNYNIIKDDLNKILTTTSQEDYIKCKRSRFLAAACAQLGCEFVFLPDISPNLAMQLLTDIALGRGGSASLDVSLIDDRFSEAKLVRPLKNLDEVEVRLYLRIKNLEAPEVPKQSNSLNKPSIQRLTKTFVQGLQKNCPSTVSTVFRVGAKICPIRGNSRKCDEVQEEYNNCAFCKSDLGCSNSKTVTAIEFSQAVSELGGSVTSSPDVKTILENYKCKTQMKGLREPLCYGCCNIFNDYQNETGS